jgi:hypothetical protein
MKPFYDWLLVVIRHNILQKFHGALHILQANASAKTPLNAFWVSNPSFELFVAVYSRNVKRFVCSMFMARVASKASITQDMLISLAPVGCISS